jgi:hypothetical protein
MLPIALLGRQPGWRYSKCADVQDAMHTTSLHGLLSCKTLGPLGLTWNSPVNGVQNGSGTREGCGDCSAASVAALGCVRPALGGVAHPTMRSNIGEPSSPIRFCCAAERLGVMVALPGAPNLLPRTAGGGDMKTAATAAAAADMASWPGRPVRLLALLGRPMASPCSAGRHPPGPRNPMSSRKLWVLSPAAAAAAAASYLSSASTPGALS